MRQVKTSINIGCSPGEVWRVLMDFAEYGDWNPYITQIIGIPATGNRLRLTLSLPNDKRKIYRPKVTKVDIRREMRLQNSAFLPGLFRNEHVIRLVSRGAMGSSLYQEQSFSGLMIPFIAGSLLPTAQAGLEAMNEAVKQRCEGGPALLEVAPAAELA